MPRPHSLAITTMLAAVLIVATAGTLYDVLTGNFDAFWWQILALQGHLLALILVPAPKATPAETRRVWLDGYRFALTNHADEVVQADQARYSAAETD